MASPSSHYALAVTLPCYKDSRFLSRAVTLLEKATQPIASHFIILIAEDGSNSSQVVRKLMLDHPNVLYFQNNERLGRGRAIMNAWQHVRATTYAFMDVDMSTDLFRMNAYANLIENASKGGFDLVSGSRYHHDSVVYRPIVRWFASIAYNRIVRFLFHSKMTDHQCGFKAFSAALAHALPELVNSAGWFWDTEVIIVAQKMGFKVTEIPVFWVEARGPSTPIKRLLKDIWLHGVGTAKLLWRVYFGKLQL